jgi:hypothetical protein
MHKNNSKKPRENKAKVATEEQEARALMKWVRTIGIKKYPELALFYHIPNGEKRNVVTGARLKAMGVMAGIPDYHLPVGRGPINSLYIELKKRKAGRVNKNQVDLLERLELENNRVEIARGWEEAVKIIEEYLG